METTTLDKANLVSEIQYRENLSHAVTQGRRSDFALMLAMLSHDATETTPLNPAFPEEKSEDDLREMLNIPKSRRLVATDEDYLLCEKQADSFHQSSLPSAKFQDYLSPSALFFSTPNTHDFPERVFHNLSGHSRRKLAQGNPVSVSLDTTKLYNQLVNAKRYQELHTIT